MCWRSSLVWVFVTALVGTPALHAELPARVLLLSGLAEPDPDAAFEKWTSLLGNPSIVGKPDRHSISIGAWTNSVKAEIRQAYDKAGHRKVGIIAHSIAATSVLEAILKDTAIRQNMVDRVVLISPVLSGIDASAHDLPGILSFTGMSADLVAPLSKGSSYYDGLYKILKNTAARIQADPSLLARYPKILLVASKDDGIIPISTSTSPITLAFFNGPKIRLGLHHGRYETGKRPILSIKNASDPVYKLATLFLNSSEDWKKISRDPNASDKGEIVMSVDGSAVYLKQNGKDAVLTPKQNSDTKRYFLEGLDPARYHIFVDGIDGGEIVVGIAQYVNTPAPIPGAQAPTARFTASPTSGPVPLAVSFNGSASSDPDGQVVTWDWSFGDGSHATSVMAGHGYAKEGNYVAVLIVTDNDGLTAKAQQLIAVTGPNTPPIASFTVSPTQGDTNTTFVFNGTSSSDPDGQIVSYTWNFGDTASTANGQTATHKYLTNGTYTASLTVVDNKGASDTETAQVKVSLPNVPPTVTISGVNGGTQNPLKVVVQLDASDSDGAIVAASIDFGEGAPVSLSPGQSAYHIYSTGGAFEIKGSATDNSGATATSNSLWVYDRDNDKYADEWSGNIRGTDCNDNDATVHPGAPEAPDDHKDSNCNGQDNW